MEKTSLPKQKNLSNIYIPEQLNLIDLDPLSVDISSLQQEKSPLTRILEPALSPKKEIGALDQPLYNQNILRLLDDLQCPVLLLPRIKNENSIQRIGFLTDLLFTGRATLAILVKIAKSIQANITLFNIPEPAMPEMDPGYAKRYFNDQGLSVVNELPIKLVNIKKSTSTETMEAMFDQHQITMAAAAQKRKDLLYRLVS